MCLAVPAEVVRLEGNQATVSVEGALRDVDVSLVEPLAVGDFVLVHAGFALHTWTPDEVREWREILQTGASRQTATSRAVPTSEGVAPSKEPPGSNGAPGTNEAAAGGEASASEGAAAGDPLGSP